MVITLQQTDHYGGSSKHHITALLLSPIPHVLVSIDGKCTIRAYSSVSQSWVEATSTGDRGYQHANYVAAAVLPTGELVLCSLWWSLQSTAIR